MQSGMVSVFFWVPASQMVTFKILMKFTLVCGYIFPNYTANSGVSIKSTKLNQMKLKPHLDAFYNTWPQKVTMDIMINVRKSNTSS